MFLSSSFTARAYRPEVDRASHFWHIGCMAPDTRRLVTENYALALWIARRYADNGIPFADLAQEGCIGLLIAASKFDPARGRFGSYASFWIKQRIRLCIKVPQFISLDEEVVEGVSPLDILPDTAPPILDALILDQDIARVRQALGMLSDRERQVVTKHYGFGGSPQTFETIGQALGVSRQRISQIHEQALRKLRALIQ